MNKNQSPSRLEGGRVFSVQHLNPHAYDCGATSRYLYCADTSVSDFDLSCVIWNTLTVRSARSPFASNDTMPWIVGTFAVWIASRTFARVTGFFAATTRFTASMITSD